MFEARSYQAELIDDLSCAGAEMAKTLRELDVINRWLGGHAATLNGLDRILKRYGWQTPVSIADMGCGGADALKAIYRWSRKQQRAVELEGIDANDYIVEYARQRSTALPIRYQTSDIFSADFKKQRYDIITASLFCHHFTDEALIQMLRQWREQARLAVLINDLHRHWFAYYSIKYLTALLSDSMLIKHDAPLSVLRAFTRQELEQILAAAGIDHYELRWRWAFRYQIIIWTAA